jgi:membrane protein CcdC involved in cytochrome C biogenesis
MNVAPVVVSLVGLAGVLVWRVREARTAVTARKIIIPPVGMATGFCMFLAPAFRVPITWALIAFVIGACLLSYPLLRTSRLTREGDVIMMQRSRFFYLVVIALAIVRILARGYINNYLSIDQTAGLFFILAFGMILVWRVWMYFQYRQLAYLVRAIECDRLADIKLKSTM